MRAPIVADTGAIVALVDADDKHHVAVRDIYDEEPDAWVLPWSILAEVDYLLAHHVGARAQQAFLDDLSGGVFDVEWGGEADLGRAAELHRRYRALRLGLVDATVISVAERLGAQAIVTLDLRHFGAVSIKGRPRLLPRDRG